MDEQLKFRVATAYKCCFDCGHLFGTYVAGVSSVWQGTCDVCQKQKGVTETRDFNYLKKTKREFYYESEEDEEGKQAGDS